jgi:hypothetical protein
MEGIDMNQYYIPKKGTALMLNMQEKRRLSQPLI